jgi:hypothetical protein
MGTAVFCREAMVARREEEGRRWAEVAGVWDVGEDSTRRGRRVAAMAVRGKRARVPATESQRIRFQGSARSGREGHQREKESDDWWSLTRFYWAGLLGLANPARDRRFYWAARQNSPKFLACPPLVGQLEVAVAVVKHGGGRELCRVKGGVLVGETETEAGPIRRCARPIVYLVGKN